MGGDLGGAIKNFKGAMKEGEAEAEGQVQKLASSDNAAADGAKSRQNDKV